MKQRRASGLVVSGALVLAASAPAVAVPALSSRDAIVIAEAFHLWQTLGDSSGEVDITDFLTVLAAWGPCDA